MSDVVLCTARNRRGQPCKNRPVRGATVCSTHGGSAPQVRRKAAERVAMMEVATQISAWGGRLDVTAPEALLELVQTKAAEVAYWNHRVAALSDADRAGMLVAKTEVGEGPQGPVDTETKQPAAHVFVVLLHKAQDQLAAYSAAAVRAGVDEALVKVAAVQATAVIELARAAVELARRDPTLDADQVLLAVLPGGERL